MMAHAIICIFVDCMLVALPLWVVTGYFKMGVKSIQILLIFSLGIFGVATGIVRFAIITTTDFTVNTYVLPLRSDCIDIHNEHDL